METVNIHEAKTQLSRLVDRAAQGAGIGIAKAGKLVARLVQLENKPQRPRMLGLLAGSRQVPEDIDGIFAAELETMFYGQRPREGQP